MLPRHDRELADIVIDQGLLPREEVELALLQMEQSRRFSNLGEYLYSTGKLSAGEIRELLISVCECVMRCRSCKRKFGVRRYDPEKTYHCQHCGGDVEILPIGKAVGDKEHSKDRLLGRTLGHFKLVARLGHGGAAIVYRAVDLRLDRKVALKILPCEVHDPDSAALARFIREARAIARVHHPAIVSVFDVGEVDGLRYIAMEYVDGESLRARVGREGHLSVPDATKVTATVARALHVAHEAGIVHRDVKPGNILIGRGGSVHVTDFGLAKFSNDKRQITIAGSAIGTPAYMSPEQCRGKSVDRRSDIYSLGLTYYYLLTGAIPYEGTSLEIIQQHVEEEAVANPRTIVGNLPESVCMVVEKMTNKNPASRYQDALALAEDLERVLVGESPVLPGMFDFLDEPEEAHTPQSVEIVLAQAARKRLEVKEEERRARKVLLRQWISWSAAAVLLCGFAVFHVLRGRGDETPVTESVRARSLSIDYPDDPAHREIVYLEEELGRANSLTDFANFFRKLDDLRDRYDDPSWAQRVGRLRHETIFRMQQRFDNVDDAAQFLADSGRIEQARDLYETAIELPVESIRRTARERLEALATVGSPTGAGGEPVLGSLK